MTELEIKKLKGFLGLCYRAGQVILGQDACVDAVRRQHRRAGTVGRKPVRTYIPETVL